MVKITIKSTIEMYLNVTGDMRDINPNAVRLCM